MLKQQESGKNQHRDQESDRREQEFAGVSQSADYPDGGSEKFDHHGMDGFDRVVELFQPDGPNLNDPMFQQYLFPIQGCLYSFHGYVNAEAPSRRLPIRHEPALGFLKRVEDPHFVRRPVLGRHDPLAQTKSGSRVRNECASNVGEITCDTTTLETIFFERVVIDALRLDRCEITDDVTDGGIQTIAFGDLVMCCQKFFAGQVATKALDRSLLRPYDGK